LTEMQFHIHNIEQQKRVIKGSAQHSPGLRKMMKVLVLKDYVLSK